MKFLPVNLSPEALKEKQLALAVELDLQRSVKATLAQLHENDRQSFIQMYYQSYGLSLLHCELLDPSRYTLYGTEHPQ